MKKLSLLVLSLLIMMPTAAFAQNEKPVEKKTEAPAAPKAAKKVEKKKEKKSAQPKKGQPTQAAKPSAPPPAQAKSGLFGVAKQGDDYFFDIPDTILGKRILATVRFISTPADLKLYGGELVNQQTVYWEKTPNNHLALRSDPYVTMADKYDEINKAVTTSNENPIIGSFKIEQGAGKGASRIKVTQFLLSDNGALTLSKNTKTNTGAASLMPQQSYIEEINTFPLNTEVKMVTTWMAPSGRTPSASMTGKLTFRLNVSFVQLPDKPMQRRLFDPRVGYFTDGFTLYSDDQQRVANKRFITRWRLEPKNEEDAERMKRGELVEPKKQIVYYIDPATPKQWRKYLIAGVEDWQEAFEQAGFKNAIVAKEWPDSDKTMSMEDARYSVIRYLASDIPNAYGPQVHDPRTGEILESHICWYHNVMKLVHDWYMVQAGTLDEAAQKMKFDEELMGQLIRFVSSHEVGHTLGLRHNFGSSSTVPVEKLRDKAWVEKNGHTPSIMDYARFNYVAQPEDGIERVGIFPRIGDYDKWAIKWGYSPMWDAFDDESDHRELEKLVQDNLAKDRRLWFGDGEMRRGDPRCQTEDLGDDAILASHYGILNLKRQMKNVPEWSYDATDIYNTNAREVYNTIISQFNRYMGHVMGNIGGVYYDFKTVDESGDVYQNTPAEKQRAALNFVAEQVFSEPTWMIEEDYVNRFTNNPHTLTINVGNGVVNSLMSRLEILNSAYPAKDFLDDMTRLLIIEKEGQDTEYIRMLQSTYVSTLCNSFKQMQVTSKARPATYSMLRKLSKMFKAQPNNDHYASLADYIERVLDYSSSVPAATAQPSRPATR